MGGRLERAEVFSTLKCEIGGSRGPKAQRNFSAWTGRRRAYAGPFLPESLLLVFPRHDPLAEKSELPEPWSPFCELEGKLCLEGGTDCGLR